jgi:hypothetical protein
VYRGNHDGSEVAVKFLVPENSRSVADFANEIVILSALKSPYENNRKRTSIGGEEEGGATEERY